MEVPKRHPAITANIDTIAPKRLEGDPPIDNAEFPVCDGVVPERELEPEG